MSDDFLVLKSAYDLKCLEVKRLEGLVVLYGTRPELPSAKIVFAENENLRSKLQAAEARGYELESIQASVCPEDFGIVEYVDSLKSRAEAAEKREARLREALENIANLYPAEASDCFDIACAALEVGK